MNQLEAKDNPAFAHMTAQAADVWAVISVLKLARLIGVRFIFAVLVQYLWRNIDQSIDRLETANAEQTGAIKRLGKFISFAQKMKTIFGGVKVRDMKSVIDYNQTPDGPAYKWIMANQSDLMRIDWKEFEKRVKSGSVGADCPVKFETESSVSVNYEDLLKFHGPPSERMVIQIADDTDVGLSEVAIIYPDVGPHPAPIQVKPSEPVSAEEGMNQLMDIIPKAGISGDEIGDAMDKRPGATPPDAAPVPIEAAPQTTGEPHIDSLDEKPVETGEDIWNKMIEGVETAVDKPAKLTASDDEFPDDIPF